MHEGRRYEVMEPIGRGGFGTVYRARLLGEGGFVKIVALKVLNPEIEAAGDIARRLRDEARVLGLLRHRAIVAVDGLVQLEGRWAVVMEFVDGADLAQVLSARGPLPLGPALEVIGEVASALERAYNTVVEGEPLLLVHRDIKPSNIKVTAIGETKVLDFGIAKAHFAQRESQTRSMAFGSLPYMAPERFVGSSGPEADIYALGATLFELVTGELFGQTAVWEETHAQIVETRMAVLGEHGVSEDVQTLILDCLKFAPETRPDAREVERRCDTLRASLRRLRDWTEVEVPQVGQSDLESSGQALTGETLWESKTGESLGSTAGTNPTIGLDIFSPDDNATTMGLPASAPASADPSRVPMVGVVAMSLIAMCLVVWSLWPSDRQIDEPVPAAEVEAPASPYLRGADLAAPPDAKSVLGRTQDVVILSAPGAAYLLPVGDGEVTRIPLEGATVLDGMTDGSVLLLRDGEVVHRSLVSGESEVVITGLPDLPPAPGHPVSADLAHIALVDASDTVLLRVLPDGSASEVARIPGRGWVTVTERYLVRVVAEVEVAAFSTQSGERIWFAPFAEQRVRALEVHDATGQIAIGGWFDQVHLYRIGEPYPHAIPVQGSTHSLAWIPEGSTLAIGRDSGLTLWREGETIASFDQIDSTLDSVVWTPHGIEAFDAHNARIWEVDISADLHQVKALERQIWGIASAPDASAVYVGGKSGTIAVWDPETDAIAPHPLHKDGVTFLVADDTHLASASDDKTIAVWDRATMQVIWRSKGHGFLVNSLRLTPGGLWSSSSDGTAKLWTWPELDEREVLSTKDLLGGSKGLAAIWTSPDQNTVLTGTWDKSLVVFERGKDGWQATSLPVDSVGLYSAAGLEELNAVLFVGVGPARLYLYDLGTGGLARVRTPSDATLNWAAGLSGSEVTIAGAGSVLHYRFERSAEGIRYTAAGRVDTTMGELVVAEWLGDRLIAGNHRGEIVVWPKAKIVGAPVLLEGEIPL